MWSPWTWEKSPEFVSGTLSTLEIVPSCCFGQLKVVFPPFVIVKIFPIKARSHKLKILRQPHSVLAWGFFIILCILGLCVWAAFGENRLSLGSRLEYWFRNALLSGVFAVALCRKFVQGLQSLGLISIRLKAMSRIQWTLSPSVTPRVI